jgi:hypothetical protein
MDNLEKLATYGTQDEVKQNKNTICFGQHFTQTNTNNVINWALLQTTGGKSFITSKKKWRAKIKKRNETRRFLFLWFKIYLKSCQIGDCINPYSNLFEMKKKPNILLNILSIYWYSHVILWRYYIIQENHWYKNSTECRHYTYFKIFFTTITGRYLYWWNWSSWFIVFNATFSNISAISRWSVLVVEEAGVHGENHRPWASNW